MDQVSVIVINEEFYQAKLGMFLKGNKNWYAILITRLSNLVFSTY